MNIQHDEMRAVLMRASEIQNASLANIDREMLLQAAEEVGISRDAVERALNERIKRPAKRPAPGELYFAKSADGKFYVAEVIEALEEGARIRFLKGSEHTVALEDLRPCSFLPGERIICNWPWWGPWTCTVISYDATHRQVAVSDGWSESRIFPIHEVWIAPPKAGSSAKTRIYATLIGAGAAAGAAIGSILTMLLL
jgi:hypothetical protein